MHLRNFIYIIILLSLLLNLSCGKDEPLEPRSEKKERKENERFKIVCYGVMAMWYGSCNNGDFRVKASKYCQDLYRDCLYSCMLANQAGPGCGF